MINLEYFLLSIISGAFTSLVCAMGKMYSDDDTKQDDFPDSEKMDNRITPKRILWLFRWIFQGVIGGFIVAFIFAESVRNGNFLAGWVFAISFASGSISWTDPRKSFSAIKKLIGFGKNEN